MKRWSENIISSFKIICLFCHARLPYVMSSSSSFVLSASSRDKYVKVDQPSINSSVFLKLSSIAER